ncbi:MAG: sialate O-acetylesterase, partial [Planctomycetaceae bacterium]|nr:sialate O-acetylesterase [Planctomycetaceae bacterium]
YEMGGLAWLQGWNDFCEWHLEMEGQRVGMELIRQYPSNLAAMFKDLRNDLGQPGLPIVVGELGIGGPEMVRRARNQDDREAVAMIEFRRMQADVASNADLAPIQFVATEDCWDSRLQELRQASDEYWQEKQKQGIQDTEENHLPTKQQNDEFLRRGGHWYCHYNGSAMSYCLMGQRMAQQLMAMQDDADQDGKVSRAETPERMREGVAFNLIDTNLDGFVDQQELQVLHSKIMDRRSGW